MAQTLLTLARAWAAVKSDDSFDDADIVDLLNDAQDEIISAAVGSERMASRTIRALDDLREIAEYVDLTNAEDFGNYVRAQFDLDVTDLQDVYYVLYDDVIPLTELKESRLFHLEVGNAVPSENEGFYLMTGRFAGFVYLHEIPEYELLTVHYIKTPTAITSNTQNPAELPNRLRMAIVYKASAVLAGLRGDDYSVILDQKYQQEVKNQLY